MLEIFSGGPALVKRIVVALALGSACSVCQAGYKVSVSFVTSPIYSWVLDDEVQPSGTTYLAPVNYFASNGGFAKDGALSGRTEAQLEQAVADAVQEAYRSAVIHMPGRMLNVNILLNQSLTSSQGTIQLVGGSTDWSGTGVLGLSYVGAADIPSHYQDNRVGVTLADNLSALGVTYTTFDQVVNSLAGTTAHEIGHTLGVANHDPGTPVNGVYPIMGTGVGPPLPTLPTSARLTRRAFLDLPGTQVNGLSTPALLLQKAGTVKVTDFNFDGFTDGSDYNVVLGHLGQTSSGVKRGDANDDLSTDGSDYNLVLADLGTNADSATATPFAQDANGVHVKYDPATGALTITVPDMGSASGLNSILVTGPAALSKPFTTNGIDAASIDPVAWAAAGGGQWWQGYFNGKEQWIRNSTPRLNNVTDLLLATYAPGLTAAQLSTVEYGAKVGATTATYFTTVEIAAVPEPGLLGLLSLSGLLFIRRRAA